MPGPERSAEPPVPATPGLLRSLNNRVVLDLFIQHGSLSRGEVRTLTGLSKPTASQLLARLEESGLVLKNGFGKAAAPGGRAAQLYVLNPQSGYAGAIDVSSAVPRARVADVVGTLVGEADAREAGVAADAGPEGAVRVLEAAARVAGKELTDLDALVVGAPGSYDPGADELRFSDHLVGWQDPGLVAALRERLGIPVFIENDVNLVAVAEQRTAPADADNFFLLWLDDRIGGALVIDGGLYRGARGAAGEAAFLQLPGVPVVRDPARDNHGGFEDLVGEGAIRAMAAERGLVGEDAVGIVERAVADDAPAATELLTEIASRYAIGLASVLALLDPGRVVVAGSVARAGGERLRALVERELASVAITTPPLSLGVVEASPILTGALMLSLDHARDRVFAT